MTRQGGDFRDAQQFLLLFYINNFFGEPEKVWSRTGGIRSVQRKTTILMKSGLPYMCDPFSQSFLTVILFGPITGKYLLSVPVAGCTKVSISFSG